MFEILKFLTNSSQRISLCYKNFAYVIRNLLSFSAAEFHFEVFFTKNTNSQVPLTVLKCPLSVLERCPSDREFSYSKMTEINGRDQHKVSVL